MKEIAEFITNNIVNHMGIIETIVFWYPISMGMLWVIGSLIYYYRIERRKPLPLTATPMVSILVPAYNEKDNIAFTIEKLNEIDYPNYEILIINDGSSDNSSEIEKRLAKKYSKVRFVDLKENCGKANALYLGLIASKGEFLVCVDGDSYLDKDCLNNMIPHFINPNNGERVGAVTGNPRVRNRSSLLAKLQLCEYASIISLIKRTQRVWGKVMTVSGVVVAYRKRALLDSGLWDRDLITEDIGVTWKLEKNFWDIRYEPRAICWMLVPETLKGIVKQRKRWAQGGQEVMFRHANIFRSWTRRRMFPIYFEQVMSILWVILWLLLTLVEIFKLCYGVGSYIPYLWKSQFIAFVCICQFLVAMLLERKYDEHMMKSFVVAAWYPLIYWVVNGLVALLALPSTIKNRNKKLATWNSPDRGIGTSVEEMATSNEDTKLKELGEETLNSTDKIFKSADTDELDIKKSEDPNSVLDNYSNIITGNQKIWKKIIEVFVTIIAWLFIVVYVAYVVYGVICLSTGKTLVEIFIYNERMLMETKHLIKIAFIIFLMEWLIMIYWKEYNRLRYGKLNRRKFKSDVGDEELSHYFKLDMSFVEKIQNDDLTVLNKNIIPENFVGKAVNLDKIRKRETQKRGKVEKKRK